MNIIQAIDDKNLFRPFLQDKNGKISSWSNWKVALRCLYGQPIRKPKNIGLIKQCTGRDAGLMPTAGFDAALFLTGRRSGKSRMAAIVGAYEAVLSGRERLLAKGELGMVGVVCPTKKQGRIVRNYLRSIFETPMLQDEVEGETSEGFQLSNGVTVEILVGDWRSIRGYSLLAAVIDEICFFGLDAESFVRNDVELVNAIRPALATTGGKLIGISSTYARKGWAYSQWKKHFGNNDGNILIWNCPSRTMNQMLPQSIIDRAMEEDLASAQAEYMGLWRDDVCVFLPREIIENCVIRGRKELLPIDNISYSGFVDVAGGRNDDAAMAIAHRKDKKTVIDFIRRYKSPHSPHEIINKMAVELKRFGLRQCQGDNYAAQFVVDGFAANGIRYEKSDFNKSQLYMELLPRISSGGIELLDDELLINQLASLERRTRSGGNDVIDHPQGGHDDIANAVSGAAASVNKKRIRIGAF